MEYRFGISLLKDRRRWRQDLFFKSDLCCHHWWGWLLLYAEWNRGERRSVKRQAYWRMLRGNQNKDIRYIEVHSLSGVWNIIENVKVMNTPSFLHQRKTLFFTNNMGGETSIRRYGKEDAQVTERRRGLPCSFWKMWNWLRFIWEWLRDWTCQRCRWSEAKQEMKPRAAVHKGKALVLRWLAQDKGWKGGLGGFRFNKIAIFNTCPNLQKRHLYTILLIQMFSNYYWNHEPILSCWCQVMFKK